MRRPIALGPTGQNWDLPPLNPSMLKHTGYEKFAHLLRENMRLYGVLRIDHVMALCRLWWVLKDKTADFGAYVHYDAEVTLPFWHWKASATVASLSARIWGRYPIKRVICSTAIKCSPTK